MILLFDLDGTIVEPGKKISNKMKTMLQQIKRAGNELGIVGGGQFNKIMEQLDQTSMFEHNDQYKDKIMLFKHIFAECGSVYYKLINNEYVLMHQHDIRQHKYYCEINKLMRTSLKYIATETTYPLSGNQLDLRKGLVYISMVGMQATNEERQIFIEHDQQFQHKKTLLKLLLNEAQNMNVIDKLDIKLGGHVGIAIYPKEWNKTQVLDIFPNSKISYFGDQYAENGNDYEIITDKRVTGFPVNSPDDTFEHLHQMIYNQYHSQN